MHTHTHIKNIANMYIKYKIFLSSSLNIFFKPTSSPFKTKSSYLLGLGMIQNTLNIDLEQPATIQSAHTYNVNGIEGICVIIILSLILSIVLITLSYLLSIRKWDAEKLSPYECGFEPFGDARQKFDIRYYLVSLLFILFDLEVSYLFPLIAVDHTILTEWGYIIGAIFIVILTVGFIYEYSKEALDNI